ncbi:unnamed protein product [Protopolystoma xenopodis]|uniref:Uncharacterized protein n=1 Tax=Protopolystoma xenopodis TaxID=117903 RepID=A0A448XRN0_9PLAT|nr:unnamed protein product [Protopolystoma xenopodis]
MTLARKDLQLSPFDVVRRVLCPDTGGPDGVPASVGDCIELFFQDYGLGPLFVQENYLHVKPKASQ